MGLAHLGTEELCLFIFTGRLRMKTVFLLNLVHQCPSAYGLKHCSSVLRRLAFPIVRERQEVERLSRCRFDPRARSIVEAGRFGLLIYLIGFGPG